MKRTLLALCAICTLMIVACNNGDTVKDHDTQLQEIAQMEQEVSMLQISDLQADSLIGLYKTFASSFPEDSLVPGFLMKAGQILTNIGRPDSAIQFYDQIIDSYGDFDQLAECYFYKAYAYEQGEHYEEAAEAYGFFANEYPDHVLAAGLKTNVIPNLGKMESLVNGFANDPKNQDVPIEEI